MRFSFKSPPTNSQIKFVISDEADYDFACDFIREYALLRKVDSLLFSPMNAQLPPQTLAEWMIRDRVPARLQLQLHKYIWPPDARGV